ncbi:hypothetical protein Tco_0973978 [Tanacetum coccineum]|uniref:Uncharacterized protein n=1 Tax=Tanacetum coccineum TaxID=301880 RepID=A0ABQ5EAB2_9ASTR
MAAVVSDARHWRGYLDQARNSDAVLHSQEVVVSTTWKSPGKVKYTLRKPVAASVVVQLMGFSSRDSLSEYKREENRKEYCKANKEDIV